MRISRLLFGVAVILGVSVFVPFLAAAAGLQPEVLANRGESACESACHDAHGGWVDLCIEYHDPHEILPSARGQCIAEGAERLRQCLENCR